MAERSGNLSFIKYTNEQWVYVIEYGRESSIASQALVLSDDGFPHDRIKKLMELGKRVIHVAFGEGCWAVLMQEEAGSDGAVTQRIEFSRDFPEDRVNAAWTEKRRIAFLDYMGDQWVLVTEPASHSTTVAQTVAFSREQLPGKEIQADLWEKDKKLVCLAFHQSTGWVLLGENRGTAGQGYAAGSDWPEEKVADRFAKGMTIAGLAWSTTDEAWSIVFNNANKNESITSKVHFHKSFNEDLCRTLQLTRYGKRF